MKLAIALLAVMTLSSTWRQTAAFSLPPTAANIMRRYSNSNIMEARTTVLRASVLSSMTESQLSDLLRQQGLNGDGNKEELIERLEQSKKEQIARMMGMAATLKEKQTESECIPGPSLKTQVAMAVESGEAKAKEDAKRNIMKGNKAKVSGFRDLNVPSSLVARLDAMGIMDPTPIQWEAIPLALEGKDVTGVAQTGTGKTLAFGVPLVAQMMKDMDSIEHKHSRRPLRGLILAPTRELANQIAVQLGALMQQTPLNSYVVVGGQNLATQMTKLKAMRTDLLVATPGRLLDLMEREALSLKETSFLVLDEADLMLDMGFLPDLRKISKMLPKERQTMLFSATMSKDMNEVANSYLQSPVKIEIARAGKTADKIAQEIHFLAPTEKTNTLLAMLSDENHRDDRAIVFGRTKHGIERLTKKLVANGIQANSIHGNKTQPQRDRALAAFKAGEIKVLVATDVAARGLDIPDVKRVYNFELPKVPEAYVHRIGRTARAGKEGIAISFCTYEDMDNLRNIEKLIKLDIPVASSSGAAFSEPKRKQKKDGSKVRKPNQERKQRDNKKKKKKKPVGDSGENNTDFRKRW